MDPVARAKTAFFTCLGASVATLLLLDFHVGPAAFAVSAPQPAPVVSGAPTNAPTPTATPSPTTVTPPPTTTTASDAEANVDANIDPNAADAAAYAEGKITGVVATFEFEQASADLSRLRTLAKQMQEDPTAEIVLEGHSDPSGNEYRNLALSLDRANWAADRLTEFGVNRLRIRTVGLGSARPIVDLGGDAGAVNRRVEVRWVLRTADGGGR